MTEKRCSNCYWWDAAAAPEAVMHRCYHTSMGGSASTANYACEFFRAASPDDPATLWNRKHPGHKKRKPKEPEAVKRGRRAKKKGRVREKELAELLTKLTGEKWIVCGHDKDVQPEDPNSLWRPTHVECKGHKRVAAMAFCEQAMADAAKQGKPRWLSAYRVDAKQGYKKPPWIAQVPLVDYVKDMQELKERREKDENA